jgi:hypothetical protein
MLDGHIAGKHHKLVPDHASLAVNILAVNILAVDTEVIDIACSTIASTAIGPPAP